MQTTPAGLVRHLRKEAQRLRPVVIIGKHGLEDDVLAKSDAELTTHELIKVRILDADTAHPRDSAQAIVEASRATLIQVIGKTLVLFRLNHKHPPEIPIRACGLMLDRTTVRRLMYTTPKEPRV